MITLLGFDPEDPPKGCMTRLVEVLEDRSADNPDSRGAIDRNYIILDNFMPFGYNQEDSSIVNQLKGVIRDRLVTVLVLTPSEDAASTLLSENNLVHVQPLADVDCVKALKNKYSNITPGMKLDFDWKANMSTRWDKDELRKALFTSTNFTSLDLERQNEIRDTFDEVYNGLSDTEKEAMTPFEIGQCFSKMLRPIRTPRGAHAPVDSLADPQDGCCGRNRCLIM